MSDGDKETDDAVHVEDTDVLAQQRHVRFSPHASLDPLPFTSSSDCQCSSAMSASSYFLSRLMDMRSLNLSSAAGKGNWQGIAQSEGEARGRCIAGKFQPDTSVL